VAIDTWIKANEATL